MPLVIEADAKDLGGHHGGQHLGHIGRLVGHMKRAKDVAFDPEQRASGFFGGVLDLAFGI